MSQDWIRQARPADKAPPSAEAILEQRKTKIVEFPGLGVNHTEGMLDQDVVVSDGPEDTSAWILSSGTILGHLYIL